MTSLSFSFPCCFTKSLQPRLLQVPYRPHPRGDRGRRVYRWEGASSTDRWSCSGRYSPCAHGDRLICPRNFRLGRSTGDLRDLGLRVGIPTRRSGCHTCVTLSLASFQSVLRCRCAALKTPSCRRRSNGHPKDVFYSSTAYTVHSPV